MKTASLNEPVIIKQKPANIFKKLEKNRQLSGKNH